MAALKTKMAKQESGENKPNRGFYKLQDYIIKKL